MRKRSITERTQSRIPLEFQAMKQFIVVQEAKHKFRQTFIHKIWIVSADTKAAAVRHVLANFNVLPHGSGGQWMKPKAELVEADREYVV